MPHERAHSRTDWESWAVMMSLFGVKWDITIVTRDGSLTRLQPRALKTGIASDVESSFPMQRSTLAITISPGRTLGLPEARASTFSVAVILVMADSPPPTIVTDVRIAGSGRSDRDG